MAPKVQRAATQVRRPASGPVTQPAQKAQAAVRKRGHEVLLSYFKPKTDLPKLITAVQQAKLPAKVPVYLGTYGISAEQSALIHKSLPNNGKYAPLFGLVRKKTEQNPNSYWNTRAPGVPGPAAFAGRIPTLKEIKLANPDPGKAGALSVAWGTELGRRMRDQIEAAKKAGVKIDSWQLDELWPTAASASGGNARMIRQLFRGVLLGLVDGRPERKDAKMPGMAHVAHFNALAKLPMTEEMTRFWQALNHSTHRVVAEVYPEFRGDARARATQMLEGKRHLAHMSGIRGAVARKYMLGLTPGFRRAPGLGGQLDGNFARADKWRDAFMEQALSEGVTAIGQYNWMRNPVRNGAENDDPRVMRSILQDISENIRSHGRDGQK